MKNTYEQWCDLTHYNLIVESKRGLKWSEDRIKEYNDCFPNFLLNSFDLELSPNTVAKNVLFHFQEEIRKEEEKQAKEREIMAKRMAKNRKTLRARIGSYEPAERETNSVERQLGVYIGEFIMDHYLPCLTTDSVGFNTVIKVSEEEEAIHEKYNDEWFSEKDTTEKNRKWNRYLLYRKQLEDIYLPKKLVCKVSKIESITDMKELKEGIAAVLWNSDGCHYDTDLDAIEIVTEKYKSIITLTYKP